MIELVQETNYQESALSLLMAQYSNAEKLQGILSAKSNQANDLEQAAFEVRDSIYLEDAAGTQLDIIGKIYDVSRAGMSDSEYREEIEAKIALKISGTIPEVINILKSIYSATYTEYYPQYPGKYLMITDADISQEDFEAISPAGIGVFFKETDEDGTYYVSEDGSFYVSEDNKFYGSEV